MDSTGDEPDAVIGAGGCLTAASKCTLRAAIQESNASTAVKDTIAFAASFDAQVLADTIALGAGFPAIADAVTVDGKAGTNLCAVTDRPCVGVDGPAGGLGLQVKADDVTIEGLAITGAQTGISVVDASTGFVARGNWIGLKLDLGAGGNQTGILLGPGSDDATVGGYTVDPTNYFGHNSVVGLDLHGASGATIVGNRFGVLPSGSAVPNGKNIEITDAFAGVPFQATGNEVGDRIFDIRPGTCNEGCNTIAGATGPGVDLHGDGGEESPATGPTTIHGNYIGMDSGSDTVVANGTAGVLVGGADEVTVGGPDLGDANHIHGGTWGVHAGPAAARLVVEGNEIGHDPSGSGLLAPPSAEAISVSSASIAGPAEEAAIIENAIGMFGGAGIAHHSLGATIAGNVIFGGDSAIVTSGDAGWGNLIVGNALFGASGNAMLIKNSRNDVFENTIAGTGLAGIKIQGSGGQPATKNQIGGDEEADENEITGATGDVIEVLGAGADSNEVGRNFSEGNGGLFIDLGANGPGNGSLGPNDGIQAPTTDTATTSTLAGSARPGATVRVFFKATPSPSEVEAFLGESIADAEGHWTLVLDPAVESGTHLAATQTDEAGNTSELAFATAAVPPIVVVKDEGCAFSGICETPRKDESPIPDDTPPETTILKGPKGRGEAESAMFRFASSDVGSTFECKLDRKPFRKCKSPKKYKNLKPGRHIFRVRAIDAAGQVDATPAKRRWRIVEP